MWGPHKAVLEGSVAPRTSQGLTGYAGDGSTNCAVASWQGINLNTRPDLTWVLVYKKNANGVQGGTIAGFGATGGGPGNTLFRFVGGSTANSIRLQIQDSTGALYSNVDSSDFGANDQRYHCVVVSGAVTQQNQGGGFRYYADGRKLNFSQSETDAATGSTLFNLATVLCARRGGAISGADGNYDVALFVPLFGIRQPDWWCEEISRNPWQLFEPERRIPIPTAAAAGTHDASGVLVNAGGVIAGSATHFGNHPSSGSLTNPGGVASGVAARTRVHPASGALVNPGGVVVGSADRSAGGTTHPSSGVLANPGAVVTGTATHFGNHPSTGVLANPGAVVAGSAARVPAAVTHNATGALQNPGAVLSGTAVNESGALIDTHDGFWFKQYRKMWEYGKKKPTIPELIEAIEEEPEIVKAIPEVAKAVRKEYGSVDVAKISANVEMQKFIARQIQLTIELRALEMERDDEELLLLFV